MAAATRAAPPPQDIRSSPYGTITSTPTRPSQDQTSPPKRRQDFSSEKAKEDELRLGDYVLGPTLGAGEFARVRIGWKKPNGNGMSVAIKIIRRRKLDNPSRLAKVHREVSILRELEHPNIVRLHETIETPKTIGIILEYASGGELYDYILRKRYLNDGEARRLFAQLVSGVGYLHKKGIIHRDLKLENLLLDKYTNIIITDFGFANTFDPTDELTQTDEMNIHRKDYVQAHRLDKTDQRGFRRADLMLTSCGSPCYAAPELVVSDGLYAGRKVDVWSCGVILYAMLAGYLPFDDDPKNPEGDNINALYHYITTTTLIFADHITPHARDLLKRILVPKPRERADLFEVARHSWLSEYSSILESITSTVASPIDTIFQPPINGSTIFQPAPVNSDVNDAQRASAPRSQSARGVIKPAAAAASSPAPDGRSSKKHTPSLSNGEQRTAVPHVNPNRHTIHFDSGPQRPALSGNELDIGSSQYPHSAFQDPAQAPAASKHLSRPTVPRGRSDQPANPTRPATGGSMTGSGLPSRNSYREPLAPNVTTTNAHGHVAQPTKPSSAGAKQYVISAPIPQQEPQIGDPAIVGPGAPSAYGYQRSRPSMESTAQAVKGHKRSNTFTSLFERAGSLSGRKGQRPTPDRSHPPVSMDTNKPFASRLSTPRASFSGKPDDRQVTSRRSSRRLSSIMSSLKTRTSRSGFKTDSAPSTADPAVSQQRPAGVTWDNNKKFYNPHPPGDAASSFKVKRVMEYFKFRK